jgi:3',5'-cyclic AMP phosphodiesterase CpdA
MIVVIIVVVTTACAPTNTSYTFMKNIVVTVTTIKQVTNRPIKVYVMIVIITDTTIFTTSTSIKTLFFLPDGPTYCLKQPVAYFPLQAVFISLPVVQKSQTRKQTRALATYQRKSQPEVLQRRALQLLRNIRRPRDQPILPGNHVNVWPEAMMRQHFPYRHVFPVLKTAVPRVPEEV